jgi:NAD(P)-dependent dehydrogenase (short-subunit alcohol dehydrogenase family)
MAAKTWFITGTSRGFGHEWAIAALDRGDSVAATARDVSSLDDLVATYEKAILPIRLDVTDRDAVFTSVRQAQEHFGRFAGLSHQAPSGCRPNPLKLGAAPCLSEWQATTAASSRTPITPSASLSTIRTLGIAPASLLRGP